MRPASESLPPRSGTLRVLRYRSRRFAFEWHYHPELELTFILAGRGNRFVGNHIEAYRPGDLVLLGPGLPHTWASIGSGPHEAIVLQFGDACLGDGFWHTPELSGGRALLRGASRGRVFSARVARHVEPLFHELVDTEGMQQIIVFLRILEFLSTEGAASRGGRFVGEVGENAGHLVSPCTRSSVRLDEICEWVHREFSRPLSQSEAANRAHLSPSAFARFFRRLTGQSFVAYVNDVRICEACRRLLDTDQRVADVAYEVGFGSLSAFHRHFVARNALSPRAYRARFLRERA